MGRLKALSRYQLTNVKLKPRRLKWLNFSNV
jgi:hypothetical protein